MSPDWELRSAARATHNVAFQGDLICNQHSIRPLARPPAVLSVSSTRQGRQPRRHRPSSTDKSEIGRNRHLNLRMNEPVTAPETTNLDPVQIILRRVELHRRWLLELDSSAVGAAALVWGGIPRRGDALPGPTALALDDTDPTGFAACVALRPPVCRCPWIY